MVWYPKTAIVIWDGSPEAEYNIEYTPKDWELIVYAIKPFKNKWGERITDVIMHECEDCTYLDRLKDVMRLVDANFDNRKEVAIVLPVAWDDVEVFRRITLKYPKYYWMSFAKSMTKEGLRKFA